MKYSPSGRDQSFSRGSGSARAWLLGAAKYAINSSKVMLGEPVARSFCVEVVCKGWKTREAQSAEEEQDTPCVDSRKARKADTGRVSRFVSAEKMLRSSVRMTGEVSSRDLELASRLATPPPAPWEEVVKVAMVKVLGVR